MASPGQQDLPPRPPAAMTEAAGGLASSCSCQRSPAQPSLCVALALRGSGAKEQWWHCCHFPIPSLSQLLIKDVGGPAPTQRACPLIKHRHTQTVALQEVGDEFITWPFRRPNRHGLGQKMGQREVTPRGPFQRPPPKGKSILFPGGAPGESDGKGWVYGLLVRRRFLDGPMSVNRPAAALEGLVCPHLRRGSLKTIAF